MYPYNIADNFSQSKQSKGQCKTAATVSFIINFETHFHLLNTLLDAYISSIQYTELTSLETKKWRSFGVVLKADCHSRYQVLVGA